MQHGTRGGAYYKLNRQFLENQKKEAGPQTKILSDREEKVISYIKKEGFVTNRVLQELLGINKGSALFVLQTLMQKGLIISEGRGRATKYKLM